MPAVHPNAAGLESRSEAIWACVPEDRDAELVRSFGPVTPDRYALAEVLLQEWLVICYKESDRLDPKSPEISHAQSPPV